MPPVAKIEKYDYWFLGWANCQKMQPPNKMKLMMGNPNWKKLVVSRSSKRFLQIHLSKGVFICQESFFLKKCELRFKNANRLKFVADVQRNPLFEWNQEQLPRRFQVEVYLKIVFDKSVFLTINYNSHTRRTKHLTSFLCLFQTLSWRKERLSGAQPGSSSKLPFKGRNKEKGKMPLSSWEENLHSGTDPSN